MESRVLDSPMKLWMHGYEKLFKTIITGVWKRDGALDWCSVQFPW